LPAAEIQLKKVD